MVRCLLHLVCQKGRQERGGEGLFGVGQGRRRKRGSTRGSGSSDWEGREVCREAWAITEGGV